MNIGKRILALLLCLGLCSGAFGVLPALAVEREETPDGGYVCYLREDSLMLLSADDGLEPVPYAAGYYTVDSLEELQPYLNAGLVEAVCPNEELELFDMPDINDPGASGQWYLETLGIAGAWEAGYRGEGVTVAVIDSGIRADHEDFVGANVTGYNVLGTDETWNPQNYTDDTGHGTMVAGIIAAQTDNATGIAGLTDDVNILAIRCFSSKSDSANSGSGTVAKALEAIGYAIGQDVDVINMSFGGTGESLKTMEPLLQQAKEAGIILVAAAGNKKNSSDAGTALNYPAAFSCVTGVGSVDKDGSVSSFSYHNSSVDVTAPGSSIYGLGYTGTSSYRTDSGTSFATPMVSALAVMAKQADSAIGQEGFEALLKACALDRGEEGRDDYYGYGVVSASAFAQALDASYTITYETDGGAISGIAGTDYAVSYTIGEGGEASLPGEATKEYNTFAGWYTDSDCTGEPVTSVPEGTVGDVTFYAGWSPKAVDCTISGVSVSGYAAALTGTTWSVTLPYETDLSQLQAGDIEVAFADSRAACTSGPEKQPGDESGETWTFTVGETDYTVRISRSAHPTPAIAAEQSKQSGEAVPTSYDGKTDAEPYTAELTGWFTGVDEETLFEAEVTEGTGTASVGQNNVISYTPTLADAEKTVSLSVQACNKDGFSSNPVTVSINVAPIPVSNSGLDESEAVYDLDLDTDGIAVTMLPYGNALESIRCGNVTLAAGTDYQLSDKPTLQTEKWVCTLTHTWLSGLTSGVYRVDFQFNGGRTEAERTVSLNLTVQKSSEKKTEGGTSGGGIGGGETIGETELELLIPETGQRVPFTLEDGVVTLKPEEPELEKLQSAASLTLDLSGSESEAVVLSEFLRSVGELKVLLPAGGLTLRSAWLKALPSGEAILRLNKSDAGYELSLTVDGSPLEQLPLPLTLAIQLSEGQSPQTAWLTGENGERTALLSAAQDGVLRIWAGRCGTIVTEADLWSSPFADVAETDWFEESVGYVGRMGLFTGVSEQAFAPHETMTRGMLVTVLWRMEGKPTASGTYFADVSENAWYAQAVSWAASVGLAEGDGAGAFLPDAPVSREELLTFFWRYAKLAGVVMSGSTGVLSDFSDGSEVSGYAAEAVGCMAEYGVVQGSGGYLYPLETAERAEVAAFLERLIRKVLL